MSWDPCFVSDFLKVITKTFGNLFFQQPVREDNDPNAEATTPGALLGITDRALTVGSSLIYREVIRDLGRKKGFNGAVEEARDTAHEIGHQFRLRHPGRLITQSGFPDDDIMTENVPTPDAKVRFNDNNLDLIRGIDFPR